MQHLRPYDYEKVKSDHMYSLEVITPPNNDGSRPRYAFPIKHQVLRCGKWIPTEEMYYNALYLYYYLHQEWMFNVYKDKGLLWHDAQHTTTEVDDYGRVRMYETTPSVEEVFENYISKIPKGEPDIKRQCTTSSPLSNPFSKEKYIQRSMERRKH